MWLQSSEKFCFKKLKIHHLVFFYSYFVIFCNTVERNVQDRHPGKQMTWLLMEVVNLTTQNKTAEVKRDFYPSLSCLWLPCLLPILGKLLYPFWILCELLELLFFRVQLVLQSNIFKKALYMCRAGRPPTFWSQGWCATLPYMVMCQPLLLLLFELKKEGGMEEEVCKRGEWWARMSDISASASSSSSISNLGT